MVAYFLSGPTGKNDYVCTSLTTHVFSYVCALTHFPPLPPMTTCGVIKVDQVRIFRELCTYTHSTILNIIHKCVTHSFLSIHEHPRGKHVNKVQKVCKPVQDNSTTHLLQSLFEKDCITVTCHLAHSVTTHPVILLFCHPKYNLRECVTYSFPPSLTNICGCQLPIRSKR